MKKNKKDKVGFFIGIIIAGVFILAAVLFTLIQYEFKALGVSAAKYNGFVTAFGKDNYEGYAVFCLPFFLSALAAAGIILTALGLLKFNGRALFAACTAFALISVIIYITAYFHILGKYGRGGLIALSKNVKWTFAFWCGFALQCMACFGSGYAAVSGGK